MFFWKQKIMYIVTIQWGVVKIGPGENYLKLLKFLFYFVFLSNREAKKGFSVGEKFGVSCCYGSTSFWNSKKLLAALNKVQCLLFSVSLSWAVPSKLGFCQQNQNLSVSIVKIQQSKSRNEWQSGRSLRLHFIMQQELQVLLEEN